MKKKVMMISCIFLLSFLIIVIIFNNSNNDNNRHNIISNMNKDEQVISNNMITLMYETDVGSDEYTQSTDNTWPESGYIFNDILSGCENGGKLEYDSQNKVVNLLSNSSDNCYVYFDKYDGVWIDNVVATNITGSSVTLNISASSGNGNVTRYYYSLNDSEYVSSTTNPLVIDNLNQLTEYNIKVYAVDSTNARSNVYELTVTTTDISVPVVNSVSVSNITSDGFTLTVNAASDNPIERYYFYVVGNGENYAGTSTTNSYTFNTLNSGTNYNINVFVEDVNGSYSNTGSINVTTSSILFAEYIKSLYTSNGVNGLYYHYSSSLENSAGDNSYRYAGASEDVNNYVCFGSTASPCPNDNLYRIIGVFGDQVKLIKADYANSNLLGTGGAYSVSDTPSGTYKGSLSSIDIYYWNRQGSGSDANAVWSYSYLNTTNLNSSYYWSFDTGWRNLIASHSWSVGGMSTSNGYRDGAQTAYRYEVGSSNSGTMYSARIGLMYVSDYYYAASPRYWTYDGYNEDDSSRDYSAAVDDNWMYLGETEWTISRADVGSRDVYSYYIVRTGYVYYGYTNGTNIIAHPVRPCFYLVSSAQYSSGTGFSNNPYRLVV